MTSVSAFYQSAQNRFPSRLPSKNIKIYTTIILSVVLYGCGTSSLTLREKQAGET